jgi:hypothetical protein
MSKKSRLGLIACALGVAPPLAHAYVGPGVGISAIGSFLALLGAILLAIVGFVWFPLKRRFGKSRSAREADSADSLTESKEGEEVQTSETGPDASRGTLRD